MREKSTNFYERIVNKQIIIFKHNEPEVLLFKLVFPLLVRATFNVEMRF
jgi:hypothetical protein